MPLSPDDLRSRLENPKRGLRRYASERHDELARRCAELSRAAPIAAEAFAAAWHDLDVALHNHMAAEDDLIIPAYQLSDPEEAAELRTQHARIRELLVAVRASLAGHTLDAERARQLADLLAAHARREDTSMYPWAERHLPLVIRRQLFVRFSHWLRRRANHAAPTAR
jgi:hypothetical protein